MKYIEAPSDYSLKNNELSLFIAGGITNCRPWQTDLVKLLKDLPIVVFNPRRENFDVNDKSAAQKQIEWEFKALEDASHISFWFSSETLQPITLYELGRWTRGNKPLIVGCDPKYPRIKDVQIQLGLARPDIEICYSLPKLADKIRETILTDIAKKVNA